MKYVLAGLIAVLSISCSKNSSNPGGDNGQPPPPPGTSVFSGNTSAKVVVEFDSSVYSSERTSIDKDLENIARLTLSSQPKGTEASYFGLSTFNGSTLSGWLRERLKYIIGENYSDSSVTYSSPSPFNIMLGDSEHGGLFHASTVMRNYGTGYWLDGKKYSRLYKIPVNSKYVEVRGPRVGLVQIGEALFSSSYDSSSKGQDAAVNSLRRISTYFHESRHSDGNGTHAGFPHVECPSGHAYYQQGAACDQYLNGPYTLQGVLLDSFYESCSGKDCDSSDKETLRLLSADKKSRLLSGAVYKDPTPERLQ